MASLEEATHLQGAAGCGQHDPGGGHVEHLDAAVGEVA